MPRAKVEMVAAKQRPCAWVPSPARNSDL